MDKRKQLSEAGKIQQRVHTLETFRHRKMGTGKKRGDKMSLSPRQAVKAHCQECLSMSQFNRQEVQECKGDTWTHGECAFYPYRLGKRMPVKVFRQFCIQCMNGQTSLIAECTSTNCKIYPYRFGRNPNRSGIGGFSFKQAVSQQK